VCILITNMLKRIIKRIINIQDKKISGKQDTKSLLLIRLDGIGDYILFRNFIEVLKNSPQYKNHKITLLGNKLWKDLAVNLDSKFIDNFIWLDTDKYQHNKRYEKQINKQLSKISFDVLINPIHSSAFYVHCIANIIKAEEKIASKGDEFIISKEHKLTSEHWYTRLIETDAGNQFEFYRIKDFFEKLLGTKINLSAPFIDIKNTKSPIKGRTDYAVIFPQASTKSKRWKAKNFAEISEYLFKKYNLKSVLAGGKNFNDLKISYRVWNFFKPKYIANYTGRISLCELAKIISEAKILVSNDTGAYHIGVSTGVKTLCISNGFTLGRYHPYPKEISDKAEFIYPPEISQQGKISHELYEKYRYFSPFRINSIKTADVIDILDKLLSK